jgi:signal transduction histidine kinase
LEITGSRKGSIFLYRTKENSLELELVDWTELAPVTQFNADSAQRLFHKSDTISPSSDTAIPLSGEETDSQDQKPYLSISIEDAQTVWGSLHLHGKISGEMYGPEDIIHVSSLIRKSVVVLNGFEYVGQKTIFSIDREKLKKEHQRLQLHKSSLEKSSSALVVLVDQHLKVLYTCDRYKELFGEKAILEQLNEHSIWAAFGKNIQEEFKHLVTNNEPFVAEELLSVNTSSSVRLFKIRMIPLPKNETTQVEKVFLLLLEDITEQEKITKKLLLLENLAIMGRFVAGIAHDLNNPLDGLNRLISILETKLAGKDDYGLFEVIHIAIRRMSNTIKSFLDCTRDALSKTTFTPLSELIEQSIFIMSPILSEKDIRIYKNFTANHLNLDVPTNLYNVFINLIKNAYDAMEKRGNLEISIENGDKSGFIQVVFADNGCGISETIMDDITKPFFTTKEEGTGLGLSLCKKIINSFGGELVIRNRLTQGCEVSVLIPAKDHILQAQ